ncbi:MAG: hypothetical protein NXI27_01640 [Alphaproteobacteria bacterium]|nr:hypothetical protein [Alphaproteobacteria bacterium]
MSNSTTTGAVKRWIMRNSPELQFWGYEGGNVLAAVAGAGGFLAFYHGVGAIAAESGTGLGQRAAALLSGFPDAAATIGLATIILWSLGLGAIVKRTGAGFLNGPIDGLAAIAGIILIAATIIFGASWITISAVFFVSGSALLRQCFESPVFLKLGGLLISGGGVCLTGAGLTYGWAAEAFWVAILTTVTGFYVAGAGLMTYRGGMFECNAAKASAGTGEGQSGLFHPFSLSARALEYALDRPVLVLVETVVLPSLFWIPASIKMHAPFLTSMWARLPWRLLTAIAALATGSAEGLTFAAANLLWAAGDISIGSLDWESGGEDIAEVNSQIPASCEPCAPANINGL